MRKLLLLLMSLLFVLAVNVGHANAVPDIRGEYLGSATTVVSLRGVRNLPCYFVNDYFNPNREHVQWISH